MVQSPFRIAHLSDLHIGYTSGTRVTPQGVNVREQDGYNALKALEESLLNEGVDAIIVAGDTFHTHHPTIRSIIEVQNFVRTLSKMCPVYMLGGNHDVKDVRESIAASRVVDDRERRIYSHDEPHVYHEITDGVVLHLVSHHAFTEQNETLQKVTPVNGAINILSTHGSIIDPILKMKLTTEQSPREVVIPDYLAFEREWNAILLGHIHERGYVNTGGRTQTPIFYNGSLIRRGFADKECDLQRGWTLWEIDSEGTFTSSFHVIPQRPQFDFPVIEGTNLSPTDITDIVVERLKETQIDGTNNYMMETAPIIRQRVTNLTPAQDSAINRAVISQHTGHTFSFQLKTSREVTLPTQKNHNNDENTHKGTLGIIEQYDLWVPNSVTITSARESIQSNVEKQTRSFIQEGNDTVLELSNH